ncbi:MAG: hypothetical protein DRO11_00650 [Methanobacteriota archaeon]|nr:MAG: hypothetical protein DRO11_00650 [Euryarchaeota archaeon]
MGAPSLDLPWLILIMVLAFLTLASLSTTLLLTRRIAWLQQEITKLQEENHRLKTERNQLKTVIPTLREEFNNATTRLKELISDFDRLLLRMSLQWGEIDRKTVMRRLGIPDIGEKDVDELIKAYLGPPELTSKLVLFEVLFSTQGLEILKLISTGIKEREQLLVNTGVDPTTLDRILHLLKTYGYIDAKHTLTTKGKLVLRELRKTKPSEHTK